MKPLEVTLGPETLLHTGYHGALRDHPPDSVVYEVADPTALFESYSRVREFHPCRHYCVNESYHYPGRPTLIQAADSVVANRGVPWVLDTDSLAVPLQYGPTVYHPFLSEWIRREGVEHLLAERLENLLESIAAPECLAVLFRSRNQLERNRAISETIAHRRARPLVDEVFAKAGVSYPAQPPRVSTRELNARLEGEGRGVVFAARAFEDKGGEAVLRLFRRLLANNSIDLCYIGPIPERVATEFEDVLSRIVHAPRVPRSLALETFRQAHIFLAPARHDSLPITLFEALSCGLAIVATAGAGMENVPEVVHPGKGGVLVHRDSIDADPPISSLYEAVMSLVEDDRLLRSMSEYNLALVADGPFSIQRRNGDLRAIYEGSLSRSGKSDANLPVAARPGAKRRVIRLPSSEVARLYSEFTRRHYDSTKTGFLVPAAPLESFEGGVGPSLRERELLSELGEPTVGRIG